MPVNTIREKVTIPMTTKKRKRKICRYYGFGKRCGVGTVTRITAVVGFTTYGLNKLKVTGRNSG